MAAPGGPNDAGTRGVLLPTTSVDQHGATMAQWIANFGTNLLGFLG